MTTTPGLDLTALEAYLARTRWFGGKGREFSVTGTRTLATVPGGPPLVVIHLVEVAYLDAEGGRESYQVPLAYYEHPQTRLEHAFVAWWEDPTHGWVHAYDAVHDREAMALWLRAFDAAPAETADPAVADPAPGLRFHRLPGHDLDVEATSTLFSGEQSNSSVAFGEDALMKLFRKVTPGINPDVSVHRVLTQAGSEFIAALYGWAETVDAEGEVTQLAMLQEFLRTATDGFDAALASVRSLFGDDSTRASDSGGDFAGEATRLGEALREVHQALRDHFPVETRPAPAAADLADQMRSRLDAAVDVVPELAEHADRLRSVFARIGEIEMLEVQQIHGDLHLGQTLRTASGWRIVDFEGEPAKPLRERQLPDSPWRDVAGMLRSFDYAPRVVERTMTEGEQVETAAIADRADQWAERNKNHFLVAYAGGRLSPDEQLLLEAYVADKAVYEAVYETRNRPAWVEVPLMAIARIGA